MGAKLLRTFKKFKRKNVNIIHVCMFVCCLCNICIHMIQYDYSRLYFKATKWAWQYGFVYSWEHVSFTPVYVSLNNIFLAKFIFQTGIYTYCICEFYHYALNPWRTNIFVCKALNPLKIYEKKKNRNTQSANVTKFKYSKTLCFSLCVCMRL